MYSPNFPSRMGPGRPGMGGGPGMGPGMGAHRMGPSHGLSHGGPMGHGPGHGHMDHLDHEPVMRHGPSLSHGGPSHHGGGPGLHIGLHDPPSLASVGSVTNDPNSIHCRVFVGNLNTHLMTKEDVERIFSNYGMVTGISMHKGYAFVQYTNQADARRAAHFEDGKFYANMKIDSNLASEPKNATPGRAGQKRAVPTQKSPGFNRAGNSSTQSRTPSGPPLKKVRTESINPSMKRTLVTLSSSASNVTKTLPKKPAVSSSTAAARSISAAARTATTSNVALNTSSGDILICGRCRAMFPNVHRLAMHKKVNCVVKTNCKCQPPTSTDLEPSPLTCATCTLTFLNAWDLCQHCQGEHSLNIYTSTGQISKKAEANKDEKKNKTELGVKDINGAEDAEENEDALLAEDPVELGDGDN